MTVKYELHHKTVFAFFVRNAIINGYFKLKTKTDLKYKIKMIHVKYNFVRD